MRKTEIIIAEEIAEVITSYLMMVSEEYKRDYFLQLTTGQNLEEALKNEKEKEIFTALEKRYEKNLYRELLRTLFYIIYDKEKKGNVSWSDMYIFRDNKIKKFTDSLCNHSTLVAKYEQSRVLISSFYFINAEEYIREFFEKVNRYCK